MSTYLCLIGNELVQWSSPNPQAAELLGVFAKDGEAIDFYYQSLVVQSDSK